MKELTDAEWADVQELLKAKNSQIKQLKQTIRSLCQELEMWVGKEEEYSSSGGILDNGRELLQRAREATR
jgi:hypothetical protein